MSTPMIVAHEVQKYYGGFHALKGVNLEVEAGAVTCIVGPSGSGKSTLIRCLNGLVRPDAGTIVFDGMALDTHSERDWRRLRLRVGMVFQDYSLFPHLTVLDNVRVALQRPNNLAHQFWRPLSALDSLNARAEQLIASVGLSKERDAVAADLSYGRKRVLEIATTLALDPKVLLLDEPMAGMGLEDVNTVSAIIRDVARDRAVLMVEHNLSVVADICHHVTVLQRGEILAQGDYATVSRDPRVREAYMGTEEA